MVKIQIDISEDLNRKLIIYRVEKYLNNKEEAIEKILSEKLVE